MAPVPWGWDGTPVLGMPWVDEGFLGTKVRCQAHTLHEGHAGPHGAAPSTISGCPGSRWAPSHHHCPSWSHRF